MKFNITFLVALCPIATVQASRNCHTLLSELEGYFDLPQDSDETFDAVKRASKLMTTKCIKEFQNQMGDSGDPFTEMRSRVIHIRNILEAMKDNVTKIWRVVPYWRELFNAIPGLTRARTPGKINAMVKLFDEIHKHIGGLGEHPEKFDAFDKIFLANTGHIGLPVNAGDFEVMPTTRKPLPSDALEMVKGATNNINNTTVRDIKASTAGEGNILVGPSDSSIDPELQPIYDGATTLRVKEREEGEKADLDYRNSTIKKVSKSGESIEVLIDRSPPVKEFIPCNRLVPFDIKKEKVQIKDFKSKCLNELDRKTLKAFTAGQVSNLDLENFTNISFRVLQTFYQENKLFKVPSTKLEQVGKSDGMVCAALDGLKNFDNWSLPKFSSKCILAAPDWDKIVAQLGSSTPADVLVNIDPQVLADKIASIGPKMTSDQWKKMTTDLCAYLEPDIISGTPFARNISVECLENNLNLIPFLGDGNSATNRNTVVKKIAAKNDYQGVDDRISLKIFNAASPAQLEKITAQGDACPVIGTVLDKLEKSRVPALLNCSGASLKRIEDEQMDSITKKPDNCKRLTLDHVMGIGVSKFFDKVNNACLAQLKPEIWALVGGASNYKEFPWKKVTEEQIAPIPGIVLTEVIDQLPVKVAESMSDVQLQAFEKEPELQEALAKKLSEGKKTVPAPAPKTPAA